MTRSHFHSESYKPNNGSTIPVTTVKLHDGSSIVPIEVLVDTGCSSGIFLTRRQFNRLRLRLGQKINEYPEPCTLADGTKVGVDIYRCLVELSGERKLVHICVLDPEIKLETKDEPNDEDDEPLLGMDFLNHFDAIFSGIDKKLTFLK